MSDLAALELLASMLDTEARLNAAIQKLGPLPVGDRAVQRILSLCRAEQSPPTDLIAALEANPGFTSSLLRYANSDYVARPVRAYTIREAVTMNGPVSIGHLALEAVTCRYLERAAGDGRSSVGLIHAHASAVASCSLELARRSGADADIAHLAGLLHDIGKVVLALAFGEHTMAEIAACARSGCGCSRSELEHERLGCDHALAGALMAHESGISAPVVAAILGHHDSGADPTPETACVQVADTVVGMLAGTDPDALLLDRALAILGLDESVLDDVAVHARPPGADPAERAPRSNGGRPLAARILALEQEACTDRLTGLANRRGWSNHARAHVAARGGAVLICNVDGFKHVNNLNGHAVGDMVLSEIAVILSQHGFAGRLGGDELVLLLDVPRHRARAAAEAIVGEVRAAFPPGSVYGWAAGVSIGIAVADEDTCDVSALLRAADEALYLSRRSGRGRITLAA